jgi:hypothetical protein
MPEFVERLKTWVAKDEKQSILKLMKVIQDFEPSQGAMAYGSLCRIFDTVPFELDAKILMSMKEKYQDLSVLFAQQNPDAQTNLAITFKLEQFLRELLKECCIHVLNNDGRVEGEIDTILQLQSMQVMTAELRSKAIIFSLIHYLEMGVSASVQQDLFTAIAKEHTIDISHSSDPLQAIISADVSGKSSGARAYQAAQNVLATQRLIHERAQVILNTVLETYPTVRPYVNIQSNLALAFLNNYMKHGYVEQINNAFLKECPDLKLKAAIKEGQSFFKRDLGVVGDAILEYIAEHYPEELKHTVRRLSLQHSPPMKEAAMERLRTLSKCIRDSAGSAVESKMHRQPK